MILPNKQPCYGTTQTWKLNTEANKLMKIVITNFDSWVETPGSVLTVSETNGGATPLNTYQ